MNISIKSRPSHDTRGLSVYIDEDTSILWIGAESENIGEDICCYIANDNGTFTWKGNIWLPRDTKEELPATIRDEKHLREVIDFISKDATVIQELAA